MLRQFFSVYIVVVGDDLPQQRTRLSADVPFSVGQQIVEKMQRQLFLMLGHICGIFRKDIEIGPQALPFFLASGCFQQTAESQLIVEDAHDLHIVLDRRVLDLLHHGVPRQKDRILSAAASRLCRLGKHVRFDAQILQVVFKVLQFSIDPFVTLLLGGIHVVQLVKYHIEGFIQRIEADAFPSFLPHALDAKVRIDQQQGFCRQVLQFQIPGGMVAGDMSRHRHSILQQDFIGIVIVEIGYPLFFLR